VSRTRANRLLETVSRLRGNCADPPVHRTWPDDGSDGGAGGPAAHAANRSTAERAHHPANVNSTARQREGWLAGWRYRPGEARSRHLRPASGGTGAGRPGTVRGSPARRGRQARATERADALGRGAASRGPCVDLGGPPRGVREDSGEERWASRNCRRAGGPASDRSAGAGARPSTRATFGRVCCRRRSTAVEVAQGVAVWPFGRPADRTPARSRPSWPPTRPRVRWPGVGRRGDRGAARGTVRPAGAPAVRAPRSGKSLPRRRGA